MRPLPTSHLLSLPSISSHVHQMLQAQWGISLLIVCGCEHAFGPCHVCGMLAMDSAGGCAEVVSVDELGSGIASIRPQSLENLMKVSTLMVELPLSCHCECVVATALIA